MSDGPISEGDYVKGYIERAMNIRGEIPDKDTFHGSIIGATDDVALDDAVVQAMNRARLDRLDDEQSNTEERLAQLQAERAANVEQVDELQRQLDAMTLGRLYEIDIGEGLDPGETFARRGILLRKIIEHDELTEDDYDRMLEVLISDLMENYPEEEITKLNRWSGDVPGLSEDEVKHYFTGFDRAFRRNIERAKLRTLRAENDMKAAQAKLDWAEHQLDRARRGLPPIDRRWPRALTPSQACDMHIDLALWLETQNAQMYLTQAIEDDDAKDAALWREALSMAINIADTAYVTADMAAIASEAAVDLEGLPLFETDLMSRGSLIIFDTECAYPWATEDSSEVFAVRAVHIASDLATGALESSPGRATITVFLDVDELQEVYQPGDRYGVLSAPMALSASFVWEFGKSAPTTRLANAGDDTTATQDLVSLDPFGRFIQSVLLLMKEERYTEGEKPERATRKRWGRSSLKVPEDYCVSVTRLRRAHRSVATPTDGPSRYSHRWTVRGHYRRINKGKPNERAIFIHPYVKGPAGAPFVPKRRLSRLEV